MERARESEGESDAFAARATEKNATQMLKSPPPIAVDLSLVREFAYLTSMVNAEECDGGRGDGGDGALTTLVERLGFDASAARLVERAWTSSGTSSSATIAPAPKLLSEVSLYDFEGYLRRTREWYGVFVEHRAYAARASTGLGEQSRAPTAWIGGNGNIKDIRTVPRLFFDDEFELERHDVFAIACPRLEDQSLRNLSAASTALQDELSEHLDTIEQHLIREIGAKSGEFFTVLASLNELHEAMTSTHHFVSALRGRVSELGNRLSKPGAQMLQLHAKRDNLRGLADTFASISAISQLRADMDVFVDSADYPGALQIAEDIQKALSEDNVIRELACFRKFPEHVGQTVAKVRKAMLKDFITGASIPRDIKMLVSKETLTHLIETAKMCGLDVAENAVMLMSTSTMTNVNEDPSGSFLEMTIPPLLALSYSGSACVIEALESWSAALVESAREMQRVAVDLMLARVTGQRRQPSVTSTDESLFDTAYANAIRKLPAELFAEILRALTKTFNVYFERTSQVRLIVKGIIIGDEAALATLKGSDDRLLTVARETAASFDLAAGQTALGTTNEAMQRVIDVAQGCFAKLLGVRAPMNVSLGPRDFMRIVDASGEFLQVAETLGNHRCSTLRSTLANQSKVFVREQHNASSSKLSSLLESESWVAAKIPSHFQRVIDNLMAGGSNVFEDDDEVGGDIPFVAVGKSEYRTVNSVVMMLQMLANDVRLANHLPSLTTEITHGVIALMKQYNMSVCQLILGAGAMQVSNLKAITAKHLGLAQQGVSLLAAVLPHMKKSMCALVEGPKKFLLEQEFDRILRDLTLHKSEIHEKLVSIMRDRTQFHLQRLSSVVDALTKGESKDQTETGATEFSTALTKELGTLRRVLSELLSEDDQRDILGRVAAESSAMIATKFSEDVTSRVKSDSHALERVNADVRSILQTMKSLSMLDAHVVSLQALVDELASAQPPLETTAETLALTLANDDVGTEPKDLAVSCIEPSQ